MKLYFLIIFLLLNSTFSLMACDESFTTPVSTKILAHLRDNGGDVAELLGRLSIGGNRLGPMTLVNWGGETLEQLDQFARYLRKSMKAKEFDLRISGFDGPAKASSDYFEMLIDAYQSALYQSRKLIRLSSIVVEDVEIGETIFFIKNINNTNQILTLKPHNIGSEYIKPIVYEPNILSNKSWKPPRKDGRSFTLTSKKVDINFIKDLDFELWELRVTE